MIFQDSALVDSVKIEKVTYFGDFIFIDEKVF